MERVKQQKLQIVGAFCLSFFLFLLFSSYKLFFFAPFLAIVVSKRGLPVCLAWGAVCALIVDLNSAEMPVGTSLLSYGIGCSILFALKPHLFADHWSTLPAMTFIFASCVAIIELWFACQMGLLREFRVGYLMTEAVLPAVGDAIYAWVFFVLPGVFMPKPSSCEV